MPFEPVPAQSAPAEPILSESVLLEETHPARSQIELPHSETARPWPNLFSSLRIVAGSTLLSRVLGMFRDIASAQLFGASPVWDAFSIAFRIPNLARRLFGEGA